MQYILNKIFLIFEVLRNFFFPTGEKLDLRQKTQIAFLSDSPLIYVNFHWN